MNMVKETFFSYQGRLPRKPFVFLLLMVTIAAGVCDGVAWQLSVNTGNELLASWFVVPFSFVVLAAYLSIYARRWHDIGKSGWWAVTFLLPVLNAFSLVYLLFKPSQDGSNAYGTALAMQKEG